MAVVGMATFTVSATAEDRFYVGGSFGQSDFADACRVLSGSNCDEKDTAWRVFGGYQINRNFAAEVGYHDLGQMNVSGSVASASLGPKAWDISAVGIVPFAPRFAGYGKLGLYRAKTETTSSNGFSQHDTNTDLTWALGLQWDPMLPLGVRLEFQQYYDVGTNTNSIKSNINVVSLGVLWRF